MSRFASFLVGMGGGYIKARDKEFDRERQAKEDAWRDEQRDIQRTERQDAANLKSDIGRAASPVTMGSVVTDAAGSNAFTKDTDAAAMLADMSGAKNAGTQTQQATRVVDTAYTDPAKAAEAALAADTPDAESQRVQDVYRKAGMRSNAMQEFTANENYKTAQETRIKTLEKEGVSAAMAALRGGDPEAAMKAFQGSGSRKLPEGSKFVQTDGADIFTGKPGKVWSVVGPDGATLMPDVGVAAAKYLGIEGLIARDDKNRAEEAAAAKAALDERRVAVAEGGIALNSRKLDGMLMRGSGGGGGGGAGGGSTKNPGGINMDAIDKTLTGLFTKEDQVTGAKSLDTNGLMVVRSLSTRMPAALAGDSNGAALQAYNAYSVALTKAGGDQAKAVQMLNQALNPQPEQAAVAETQGSTNNAKEREPTAPSGPGPFTDARGRTQLLQPLYSMSKYIGDARRKMQEQSAGF